MKNKILILAVVMISLFGIGLIAGAMTGGISGIKKIKLPSFSNDKLSEVKQYANVDSIVINKGDILCTNSGTNDYCFSYVNSPYVFSGKWVSPKSYCNAYDKTNPQTCLTYTDYTTDDLISMRDDWIQSRINNYLTMKQDQANGINNESNADVVVNGETDETG